MRTLFYTISDGVSTCCYYHVVSEDDNTNPENPCDHPPLLSGYPFQGYTTSDNKCGTLSGGNLLYDTHLLLGCTSGSYACYYDSSNLDNNTTDNDLTDNNTSVSTDSNASVTSDDNGTSFILDMSAPLAKLEALNNSAIKTNNKLDTTNSELGDINSKLTGLNTNLGGKLDGIGNTLDDIKDSMNPELDIDTTEHDSAFEGAKTAFNDALASFMTTGNDIKALAGGLTPPTISASGSCVLSDTSSSFGSFSMDFSIVEILRSPLQFFLNLILLYFSLRLYIFIIRDIFSYFIGGI